MNFPDGCGTNQRVAKFVVFIPEQRYRETPGESVSVEKVSGDDRVSLVSGKNKRVAGDEEKKKERKSRGGSE